MISVYSANAEWNSSAERLWNGTERKGITVPGVNGVLEGIGPSRHTPPWPIGRMGEELNPLVRRTIEVAELLAGLTLRHMLLTQSPFIECQYL